MNDDFTLLVRAQSQLTEELRMRLQELCGRPAYAEMVRTTIDYVMDNLAYLCNFTHAVQENGRLCDMVDVIMELQKHIEQTYHTLTGLEYVGPRDRYKNRPRKEV